jgi:hypothetical protein
VSAATPDIGSPSLLVEQSRALVEAEDARFAGLQTQATTLLAVIGVIVSVASTLAASFRGRHYKLQVAFHSFAGQISFSVVLVVALALGILSAAAFLAAGVYAIAAMRTDDPESVRMNLVSVVGRQFPTMLTDSSDTSAQALLALLARQLERRQRANARVSKGLQLTVAMLGVAIGLAAVLAVLLTAGTTSTAQDTHLTNRVLRVSGTR